MELKKKKKLYCMYVMNVRACVLSICQHVNARLGHLRRVAHVPPTFSGGVAVLAELAASRRPRRDGEQPDLVRFPIP
jgi:hypothetical protein